MKQYLPNKPHQLGFKLFVLCSTSGFAHKFEIYPGYESKNRLPGEPDLGATGNVVVRLCRIVPPNKRHIVYFDNYYTSVPLVTYLAKNVIFSIGTVIQNRLPNCKLPKETEMMKKKQFCGEPTKNK